MKVNEITEGGESPLLISQAKFARQIGRDTVTLWRWQKNGWLDTPVNIAGKPYLTRAAIERFVARASSGEFAKPSHAPLREKGAK